MNKVRFFIVNSVVWILSGATIISVTIEAVWMLVKKRNYIPINRLIDNFVIGLIFGTAIILLHILTVRLKRKQIFGYIISAFGIIILLFAVYIYTGLTIGYWELGIKWLIIFIIAESVVIPLTALWYRQISLYNRKLEMKKASLRDSNSK